MGCDLPEGSPWLVSICVSGEAVTSSDTQKTITQNSGVDGLIIVLYG